MAAQDIERDEGKMTIINQSALEAAAKALCRFPNVCRDASACGGCQVDACSVIASYLAALKENGNDDRAWWSAQIARAALERKP